MGKGRRKCPRCGSTRVIPWFWGLPTPESMDDVMAASYRGELMIGGCCVSDHDPHWHCNACEHDWE